MPLDSASSKAGPASDARKASFSLMGQVLLALVEDPDIGCRNSFCHAHLVSESDVSVLLTGNGDPNPEVGRAIPSS